MIARRVLALAMAWGTAAAVLAATATGSIHVTPVVADGRVTASFVASSTFDADAEAIVRSGLLLTFTFTIELRRPSTVWMDRTIGARVVASTVKFDNLTAVYQVSKVDSGNVTWSERTQDIAQVRSWMTTFDRVPLLPREALESNAEYYVRVRMQANPRRTFSFWPWTGDAASGRTDFTFIR